MARVSHSIVDLSTTVTGESAHCVKGTCSFLTEAPSQRGPTQASPLQTAVNISRWTETDVGQRLGNVGQRAETNVAR